MPISRERRHAPKRSRTRRTEIATYADRASMNLRDRVLSALSDPAPTKQKPHRTLHPRATRVFLFQSNPPVLGANRPRPCLWCPHWQQCRTGANLSLDLPRSLRARFESTTENFHRFGVFEFAQTETQSREERARRTSAFGRIDKPWRRQCDLVVLNDVRPSIRSCLQPNRH